MSGDRGERRGAARRRPPADRAHRDRPAPAPALPSRHPALLAALAVAFAGVLASVTYVLYEPDFWLHLLVGKVIWLEHAVPARQLCSWPTWGNPETNSAWLFRALVWPLWDRAGALGLFAWRWATTLAAFAFLYGAARRLGARGFTVFPVLVVCALAWRGRAQIRPETLVAVWLAMLTFVLESRPFRRAGASATDPPAGGHAAVRPDRTWLIVPVLWLWANTHLSYILGFLIAGVHLAADLLPAGGARPGRARSAATLAVCIAAAAALAFVNPFGWRALAQPFTFALEWRHEVIYQGIAELQPTPIGSLIHGGRWLVLAVWPALIVWRGFTGRRDPVEIVLCAFFSYQAWSSVRFIGYLALVAVPFLARAIEERVQAVRWPAWTRPAWTRAALAALACVAAGWTTWTSSAYGIGFGIDRGRYPFAACDFMAAHGVRGRGFNTFHLGPYQAWRFWPDRTRLPFMTGTIEAATDEDRLAYQLAFGDVGAWKSLEARRGFDYALLYRRQVQGDRLFDFLDADSTWALVFLDDAAALYVKRSGPLAAVARAWGFREMPAGRAALAARGAVWAADSARRAVARAELERQAADSPSNAMANSLLSVLAIMEHRYDDARARIERALAVDPALPRASERLGWIALEQGRAADAARAFEREIALGDPAPGVHLGLARAYERLGRTADARRHFRIEGERAAARGDAAPGTRPPDPPAGP